MKPAFERTPKQQWESFHCEEVRASSYNATWHFHPECQITLVLKSQGYRLVGDNLTPLRPGDLVLVGADLPHVWYQDRAAEGAPDGVHAIIVRFLENFLGEGFLQTPEMEPVQRLLKRARRGLHITGCTRDRAAELMHELLQASGLERVARLLSLLHLLSRSSELKAIATPGYAPPESSGDQARVERVIGYIHRHLQDPITRENVASQAHLSPGAFSRFFKLRTGKTLKRYVNELRVGRACRLLADDRLKVTDVALECGFQNLSNFNRRFHEITRLTPREFRRRTASIPVPTQA